ncbi:MAG: hypothetical protein H6553_06820 [Chitinophagales bacterium]|nr:hypothetical protein [Chitinophagales bacterium]
MKTIFIILTVLYTSACSYTSKQQDKVQSDYNYNRVSTIDYIDIIQYKAINEQAVLIGEEIKLLDENLNLVRNISALNGKIISLIGISDSLFNTSNDICNAFWYAKIQINDTIGVVNGRQVFRIEHSSQDTNITVNGNLIQILTTNFLGIGVEYNGDLVGCPAYQPVLIKDKKHNYFGLIDLIQSEYSKEVTRNSQYPYFELWNDDGAYDKIETITVEDDTNIRLLIHRTLQEGETTYEVHLKYINDKYIAKYLNFGR